MCKIKSINLEIISKKQMIREAFIDQAKTGMSIYQRVNRNINAIKVDLYNDTSYGAGVDFDELGTIPIV